MMEGASGCPEPGATLHAHPSGPERSRGFQDAGGRRSAEALLDTVAEIVRLLRINGANVRQDKALTSQQRAVLYDLRHGPLSITELAAANGISRAAASIMVDRLVVRGFLERRENPRDRRSVLVSLTEQGAEARTESEQRATQTLSKLTGSLDSGEREQLLAVLAALNRVLAEGQAHPPHEKVVQPDGVRHGAANPGDGSPPEGG